MTHDWELLKAHFEKALRLSDGERLAYLEEVTDLSPPLRDELAALLAEHDGDPGFLEQFDQGPDDPLRERARELFQLALPEPAPPELPGYEVISFIGRGGFGHTWLVKEALTGRACAVKVFRKDAVASDRSLG